MLLQMFFPFSFSDDTKSHLLSHLSSMLPSLPGQSLPQTVLLPQDVLQVGAERLDRLEPLSCRKDDENVRAFILRLSRSFSTADPERKPLTRTKMATVAPPPPNVQTGSQISSCYQQRLVSCSRDVI